MTFASCVLLAALAPQGQGGDDLDVILRAEQERVAVIERVAPAVCSVMAIGSRGGGSGVVIDPAGFVLTNFHVVGKPDVKRMRVGMPTGELHDATVLGVDPGSDLAILLLDPPADVDAADATWPYASLGDSDALLAGEVVFAMGNPFLLATDFKPTVTMGIVSGTHRYQPGGRDRFLVYPDCIQVDAPVNPGNSGGPLFNGAGEIVGINGRISVGDRGRVNVGVGFAIASNQIRNFLGDLLAGRFAEHGTMDLNAWFMDAPNEPGRPGVFVQAVFEDSRVRDFGLALGDEITKFNGTTIRSANQLATLVGVLPAGTWVDLGFRPQRGAGDGYGDERLVSFALDTLDTGSSTEEQTGRLASAEHRQLALRAATRALRAAESVETADRLTGAELVFRSDAGRVVRLRRRGPDALRIDDSESGTALVRTGPGAGFALRRDEDGATRVDELSDAERTKLETILTTNPLLWTRAELSRLVADGWLDGGLVVRGRPGIVVALDESAERAAYLLWDGTPVGCRYRDPVQDATVDVRFDGTDTRLIVGGTLRSAWRLDPTRFGGQPEELFTRPTR